MHRPRPIAFLVSVGLVLLVGCQGGPLGRPSGPPYVGFYEAQLPYDIQQSIDQARAANEELRKEDREAAAREDAAMNKSEGEARELLKKMNVDLRADNSFVMNLLTSNGPTTLGGDYVVAGDEITINVSTADGKVPGPGVQSKILAKWDESDETLAITTTSTIFFKKS